MTEKLFHVGVKALVTNQQGEILIIKANPARFIQNDEAYWDIPGGRIQTGGNALETLKREVEEETGVTELQDINFYTSVISNVEIPISKTERVGLVLMVYKCSMPEDAKIILSEENTEYEWVGSPVAAERLSYKYPPEFTDAIALF